jgi:hypothetical protein
MDLKARFQRWRERVWKLLIAYFILHIVVGLVLLGILVFAPPIVIGAGRFQHLVNTIETLDFKWYLVAAAAVVYVLPILLVIIAANARGAGRQVTQLRGMVMRSLDRSLPIKVDIDTVIPVNFTEPLVVPVQLNTTIGIDESLHIEADFPIEIDLPIDANVRTRLFPFVTVTLPIKALIPVHAIVPFKGDIKVKSAGIPVDLKEEVLVHLPKFEVPLTCRVETTIDLLDNLRDAEKRIMGKTEKDPG